MTPEVEADPFMYGRADASMCRGWASDIYKSDPCPNHPAVAVKGDPN